MTTQSDEADAVDDAAGADEAAEAQPALGRAAPRQRGRGLALLALLLAFAALGVAAWVAYRTWVPPATKAEVDTLARDNAALEARLDRELAALAATVDALAGEVASAQQKLALIQEQQQRQAEQSAGPGAQALPPAEAWQVAEAEYLLRVANHRLLLEADAAGAERMLAAADAALAAAAPFAYHEVRALLATERAALKAAAGTDVQGIFLRLDALKGQLGELPLRLPEYIGEEPEAPQPPAATTFLGALGERLAGLVRFRRSDGSARPLLPPAQAEHLLLHLRLALNHAQLAALRRDQAIYETSLANAAEWLADHVDMRGQASQAVTAEVAALQAEDLAAELPDISGSLARLRAIRAPPEPASE